MKSGVVKVGDLGIARVLAHTKEFARTMVGTPYYLSPEIVANKPYGFKSDIWSLGVLLYELCALKPPFDGTSLQMLGMRISKGSYTPLASTFSKDLRALVANMLNTDERKRPTVNQILATEIVQQRVQAQLSKSVFNSEFSHTILHKQQFMDKYGNANKDFKPPAPKQEIKQVPVARPQEVKPQVQPPKPIEQKVQQKPVDPRLQQKPQQPLYPPKSAPKSDRPQNYHYNPPLQAPKPQPPPSSRPIVQSKPVTPMQQQKPLVVAHQQKAVTPQHPP